MSMGRSFQTNYMNMHELVPYLRDGNVHDFGHDIHEMTFIGDDEFVESKATKSKALKVKLGIDSNPLDGVMRRVRFIALTSSPLTDISVKFRRPMHSICSSTS